MRIMFPMVTTLDELKQAKAVVEEERVKLKAPPVEVAGNDRNVSFKSFNAAVSASSGLRYFFHYISTNIFCVQCKFLVFHNIYAISFLRIHYNKLFVTIHPLQKVNYFTSAYIATHKLHH